MKVLLADVNNYVPVPGLPRKVMVHSQGRLGTGMGEEVQTVVVAGPEGAMLPLGLRAVPWEPDPVTSQLQLGSAFSFFALRKALD